MSLPGNFASWCTHSLALFCISFQSSLIAYLHFFTLAMNPQKHRLPGTPSGRTTHQTGTHVGKFHYPSCPLFQAFYSHFLSGSSLLFCRPSSNAIRSLFTPTLRVGPSFSIFYLCCCSAFPHSPFFFLFVHYQPTEICTRDPTAITLT